MACSEEHINTELEISDSRHAIVTMHYYMVRKCLKIVFKKACILPVKAVEHFYNALGFKLSLPYFHP